MFPIKETKLHKRIIVIRVHVLLSFKKGMGSNLTLFRTFGMDLIDILSGQIHFTQTAVKQMTQKISSQQQVGYLTPSPIWPILAKHT